MSGLPTNAAIIETVGPVRTPMPCNPKPGSCSGNSRFYWIKIQDFHQQNLPRLEPGSGFPAAAAFARIEANAIVFYVGVASRVSARACTLFVQDRKWSDRKRSGFNNNHRRRSSTMVRPEFGSGADRATNDRPSASRPSPRWRSPGPPCRLPGPAFLIDPMAYVGR